MVDASLKRNNNFVYVIRILISQLIVWSAILHLNSIRSPSNALKMIAGCTIQHRILNLHRTATTMEFASYKTTDSHVNVKNTEIPYGGVETAQRDTGFLTPINLNQSVSLINVRILTTWIVTLTATAFYTATTCTDAAVSITTMTQRTAPDVTTISTQNKTA